MESRSVKQTALTRANLIENSDNSLACTISGVSVKA